MKIFFDTEFTGLVPNTTLISIGMVSEDGKKFYAEFTDYDESLCTDWIKENVIKNLTFTDGESNMCDWYGDYYFVRGTSRYISLHLCDWLLTNFEEVQLVSDVCHYDMTLFCDLFGGAFNIPSNVNPVCYDICSDLMDYFADDTCNDYYNCEDLTMRKAFDVSREEFVTKALKEELPKMETKHNALYDAMVIKQIYEGLRK